MSIVNKEVIGILSLKVGNVKAVQGAIRRIGYKSIEVKDIYDLRKVSRLIIPGVGAMPELVGALQTNNMMEEIRSYSTYNKILGICLGFQALYSYSYEGQCKCLGLLDGEVLPISNKCRVGTNVGFMEIKKFENNKDTRDIGSNSVISNDMQSLRTKKSKMYYFVHSYYVPVNGSTSYSACIEQNLEITAIASNGQNVYGTQFHPELSHEWGRALIKRFMNI